MLFLVFQLGQDKYALEARRVIEVVPRVELKRLPLAPKGVVGLLNYRGRPVPVVDLSELTLGQPAQDCLSTRIIITRYVDARGRKQLFGLMAERATELLQRESSDFIDSGVQVKSAPYLGPVLLDQEGVIQLVDEQRLLSEPLRNLLYSSMIQAEHEST